jgi:hypothetical protein
VLFLTGPKTFSRPKGFKDICRFLFKQTAARNSSSKKEEAKATFFNCNYKKYIYWLINPFLTLSLKRKDRLLLL